MGRRIQHPQIEDVTLDGILHALADPVRRNVLRKLMCQGELSCSQTCDKIAPSTISFHYRVLRDAGLVRSEKKGVEVINTVRTEDVEGRFPGLLKTILLADQT